jgi:hypothetical protein
MEELGMRRFYFDFQEGEHVHADDKGLVFLSMKEACHAGLRTLCEVLSDTLPSTSRSIAVLVRNDAHQWTRLTVTLAFENGGLGQN